MDGPAGRRVLESPRLKRFFSVADSATSKAALEIDEGMRSDD
jgi:hypothetical protein